MMAATIEVARRTMSDAWAVAAAGIGGGVVGVVGTLCTAYLNDYLTNYRTDKLHAARKYLLFTMLSQNGPWLKLRTLAHVVGADEDTTNDCCRSRVRAPMNTARKRGLSSRARRSRRLQAAIRLERPVEPRITSWGIVRFSGQVLCNALT
jgi:hypothetical protein